MDECVATDLTLRITVDGGEENVHVHDRQVADRRGWHGVDDFAVRTGRDLAGDPDQFGAGDALLAQWLTAVLDGQGSEEALRLAAAAGAASVLEVGAGRFDPAEARRLASVVEVHELEHAA